MGGHCETNSLSSENRMVYSHYQDLGVAMRVSENTSIDWPFLGKFYDSEPLPKFELCDPYIGGAL